MNNLYLILEVNQKSTQTEIKQAYRRLVKQFHPDTQNAAEAEEPEKILQLNAAYEILGDPERRTLYDQEQQPLKGREQRRESAQKEYQKSRQSSQNEHKDIAQWQQKIYNPIIRAINQMLKSLHKQLDYLAADPFDDLLMQDFQDYLHTSQTSLEKAKNLFTSRKNPAKVAKTAASLYYCLNQLADGLEEFERFTYSYDDRALHQGQELFRLAQEFITEAEHHLQYAV